MNIEILPRSNEDVQAKINRGQNYNLKEGLDARYDVFGGDETKHAKLNEAEFTDASRFVDLCRYIRASQTDQTNEGIKTDLTNESL